MFLVSTFLHSPMFCLIKGRHHRHRRSDGVKGGGESHAAYQHHHRPTRSPTRTGTRMWILVNQERPCFCHPKGMKNQKRGCLATLLHIDNYFQWDQVTRIVFLSLSPKPDRFPQTTYKSVKRFAHMNSFRSIYQEKKKLSLGLLIKKGSRAKCEDPRDVVYLLLGMADNETTDLSVAYNPTVSTLFIRATRHIINKHRDLVVLATIEDGAIIQDLPSWTPD